MRCHWCKCRMTPSGRGIKVIDTTITVDHIKCRMECASIKEWEAKENKVDACYKCNWKRNVAYMKAHPGAKSTLPPRTRKPRNRTALTQMSVNYQDNPKLVYYHTHY